MHMRTTYAGVKLFRTAGRQNSRISTDSGRSRLPEGDVTVDVHWLSLNHKDALAITGKGKIIRNFPMIPGIYFAGTVRTSEEPRFHAGQEVLLTGWGVGENHSGGLAEQARVKGDLADCHAARAGRA